MNLFISILLEGFAEDDEQVALESAAQATKAKAETTKAKAETSKAKAEPTRAWNKLHEKDCDVFGLGCAGLLCCGEQESEQKVAVTSAITEKSLRIRKGAIYPPTRVLCAVRY
eukprot:3809319-Rhodomonas_salina.2